jgi:hypothetical protein
MENKRPIIHRLMLDFRSAESMITFFEHLLENQFFYEGIGPGVGFEIVKKDSMHGAGNKIIEHIIREAGINGKATIDAKRYND